MPGRVGQSSVGGEAVDLPRCGWVRIFLTLGEVQDERLEDTSEIPVALVQRYTQGVSLDQDLVELWIRADSTRFLLHQALVQRYTLGYTLYLWTRALWSRNLFESQSPSIPRHGQVRPSLHLLRPPQMHS